MNAQQLRNSILQMAIQGKLVPQDPNDEPASVLLSKIQKEKERLVKEGKLKKKDLVTTLVTDDEIPFDIPESWEWVRYFDIANCELGKTKNPSQTDGVLSDYLCSINVYWNKISLSSVKQMLFTDNEKNKYRIEKGDMLICEGGESGRTAIWNYDFEMYYQNALHRVRFYGDIVNFFYLYQMMLYKESGLLNGHIKGETIQHFVLNKLQNLPIPLPPLNEQKRIVAKIEELLPLVEQYGKAQTELDNLNNDLPRRLRQSILQQAIQGKLVPQDPNDEPASVLLSKIQKEKEQLVKEGKLKKKDLITTPVTEDEIPFEIPESWTWCHIDDVSLFNPRVKADDELEAGYIPMPYIEPRLVNKFRFDVKRWKSVKQMTQMMDGDIVFAKITPCITNLKCAIMRDLPNGIAGGTTELNVYRVLSDTMERKYIMYYLATNYFLGEARYKGTAGQQRILSEYILSKPFPLPPLNEQKRIVAKIEELFNALKF